MSPELAVTPAPGREHLGRCATKTKKKAVRVQELSPAVDERFSSSPKRKQRPSSGTIATDLRSLCVRHPTEKWRSNKRVLLNVVPSVRRRNDEMVVVEGQLVVAEQVDRGHVRRDPPVFRTLGLVRRADLV
uniref:Uncharacterized protein n=1 Tax=Peronospora matthiolae TaxID=2874970 RepID=A0AAV1UV77_9STRA